MKHGVICDDSDECRCGMHDAYLASWRLTTVRQMTMRTGLLGPDRPDTRSASAPGLAGALGYLVAFALETKE